MDQSKFGSQDMTWMTISNFSGEKNEIHAVPQGVQDLVRLYHENHELFLWETDLHTGRWCLCLHLTMGLEWHQLFSLKPATNKSNAMIAWTPNTLHCDSWWHSDCRNENNHTRSNPLFLKHHFGHVLRCHFHLTAPHFLLPGNSSEGSPFHANAQMSSISSRSSGQNSGTGYSGEHRTVAGIYGCSSPQALVS